MGISAFESARQRVVDWAQGRGAPVLLLQGFSGVGKSWLVGELRDLVDRQSILVHVPQGTLGTLDLLFEVAGSLEESGDHIMTARADGNLLAGLEDALKTPKFMIIDDFQEVLDGKSLKPPVDLMRMLVKISKAGGPARLLLVSNVAVPNSSWHDAVDTVTLPPPEPPLAVKILTDMLAAHGVGDSVPAHLAEDVAQWMSCNPRAIKVLANCLRSEALGDLIHAEAESWADRGNFRSPNLVDLLERRLLSRTLERLGPASLALLQCLAIYRIPFERSAIDEFRSEVGEVEPLRDRLVDNFVLELHRGWYGLQPVARQLVMPKNGGHRHKLHVAAANHYTRHFRALDSSQQVKHGKDFVEARHHLLQSGQEEAYLRIASGLRRRLLASLSEPSYGLPTTRDQRNEFVAVLTAALADAGTGHATLRFTLARLLLDRALPGDAQVALNHMRQVMRRSSAQHHWILYIRLIGLVEGASAVPRAIQRAATLVPASSLGHIYLAAVKCLAELQDRPTAIELAIDGLRRVQVNEGAIGLHQAYVALLLRAGNYSGAQVATLAALTDVDKDDQATLSKLVEAAVYPALARADVECLREVRDMIPGGALYAANKAFCEVGILQIQDMYGDAARLGEGLKHTYVALAAQTAFCCLVSGDVGRASSALVRHASPSNPALEWLAGVVALRSGHAEAASVAMGNVLGRPLTQVEKSDPNLWLRIWDTVPCVPGVYPAFNFPKLPALLTGLEVDLIRLEDQPSPIREEYLRTGGDFPKQVEEDDQSRDPSVARHAIVTVEITNQISPNLGSINNAQEIDMSSDKYDISGAAGVVGRGARGRDFEVAANQAGSASKEAAELALDLRKLRQALEASAQAPDEIADIEKLRSAESAADGGDVSEARSRLGGVSRWALGAATAIGASVAAGAIRGAAGL